MIEFDAAKDRANIAKHGVSLALADSVDLSRCTVVRDERRDYGEARFIAFAMIGNVLFALTFTYRRGNIRAISLRRARAGEPEKWQKK